MGSVLGVLVAVAAVYVAALGYLWATQRSHVFRPGIGPLDLVNSTVASYMRDETIRTGDGLALHVLVCAGEARATAPSSISTAMPAPWATGTSGCWPTWSAASAFCWWDTAAMAATRASRRKPGLYDDGRAHLDWLAAQGLRPDELVLYGESLGSAVATQLATERKAAALVLEAPFASVLLSARARYPLFAFDWVIKDKFANVDKIDRINMPLFVIHGALDRVTPQRFGRMVFERAREPKAASWPSGAGHNDLLQFGMVEAVTRFLDGLSAPVSKAG